MNEYIVRDDGTGFVEQVGELIRGNDCIFCKHIDGKFYKGDMCTVHDRAVIPEKCYCLWAERKEQ